MKNRGGYRAGQFGRAVKAVAKGAGKAAKATGKAATKSTKKGK